MQDKIVESLLRPYLHQQTTNPTLATECRAKLITLAERGVPIWHLRIVTVPRGSWRWQNAYAVMKYTMVKRKRDGVWIWRSEGTVYGKASMPQLERVGYGGLPIGGMHHQEV